MVTGLHLRQLVTALSTVGREGGHLTDPSGRASATGDVARLPSLPIVHDAVHGALIHPTLHALIVDPNTLVLELKTSFKGRHFWPKAFLICAMLRNLVLAPVPQDFEQPGRANQRSLYLDSE